MRKSFLYIAVLLVCISVLFVGCKTNTAGHGFSTDPENTEGSTSEFVTEDEFEVEMDLIGSAFPDTTEIDPEDSTASTPHDAEPDDSAQQTKPDQSKPQATDPSGAEPVAPDETDGQTQPSEAEPEAPKVTDPDGRIELPVIPGDLR